MSANVAMKTVFKMFGMPQDGTISREDFEKYAKHQQDGVMSINPIEAENIYKGIMLISDMFGLDKYAKDGGMSYTMREFEIVRRVLAQRGIPDAVRMLHSAYFKVFDTNGDHLLEKGEWSNYLKIRRTYTSEKQAMQSFDSLDKTKSGLISLEEFIEDSVDFWCNLGEEHGAQDIYGTKDL